MPTGTRDDGSLIPGPDVNIAAILIPTLPMCSNVGEKASTVAASFGMKCGSSLLITEIFLGTTISYSTLLDVVSQLSYQAGSKPPKWSWGKICVNFWSYFQTRNAFTESEGVPSSFYEEHSYLAFLTPASLPRASAVKMPKAAKAARAFPNNLIK